MPKTRILATLAIFIRIFEIKTIVTSMSMTCRNIEHVEIEDEVGIFNFPIKYVFIIPNGLYEHLQ